MKTLQIDESNAKKHYKDASPAFKQTLIDTFGLEFFSEKITDRIKSFEDACKEISVNPKSVFTSEDSKDERAYKKLKVIVKALNEGWEPDYTNSNQYKYEPRFYDFQSGFGFSWTACGYWVTVTTVGSRLCFKSRELALYAAEQFKEIYNEFLTK